MDELDEEDEASSGLPETSPHTSVRGSPATSGVRVHPSRTQAEVPEGTHQPPPPLSDVGGGNNPSTVEVQTSVMEGQDGNQGEEIPPVLKESVDDSLASPTHMVLGPRDHLETALPLTTNREAPRCSALALGVS